MDAFGEEDCARLDRDLNLVAVCLALVVAVVVSVVLLLVWHSEGT